jgi:hypothetical protein
MPYPCLTPGCSRPRPGHQSVCRACTDGLLRDLADVPNLEHHLELARSRQVRFGDRDGSRSTDTALPWDERASAALHHLRNTVVGWQRAIADDRDPPPADTLQAITDWLLQRRRLLLAHPALPEAVVDVGDAVRQARRAIDRPPERAYAGPCNECGQDLLAQPGRSTAICRICSLEYDIADRQAWMRREIDDHLAHSVAISGMLQRLGLDIPA